MSQIKRSAVAPGGSIFSMALASATPHVAVAIHGQGFAVDPLRNTMNFGGIQARVIIASSTVLLIGLPLGANSGNDSVTVGGISVVGGTPFTAQPLPRSRCHRDSRKPSREFYERCPKRRIPAWLQSHQMILQARAHLRRPMDSTAARKTSL